MLLSWTLLDLLRYFLKWLWNKLLFSLDAHFFFADKSLLWSLYFLSLALLLAESLTEPALYLLVPLLHLLLEVYHRPCLSLRRHLLQSGCGSFHVSPSLGGINDFQLWRSLNLHERYLLLGLWLLRVGCG